MHKPLIAMRKPLILAAVIATMAATSVAAAPAPSTRFDGVLASYEVVRQSLMADRWDKTAIEAATHLRGEATALARAITAQAASVPPAKLGVVQDLLAELDRAATQLVAAKDLAKAREAFYGVTKPLVRWRSAAGRGPAVAYCSMEKKSWLQPPGAIGNPYLGKSMPTCGELVK